MPDACVDEFNPNQPAIYEIRLRGLLGDQWADWFAGATIAQRDNGDTVLTCSLSDQAALHGLLKKVRDLGMVLLAVNCISSQPDSASAE